MEVKSQTFSNKRLFTPYEALLGHACNLSMRGISSRHVEEHMNKSCGNHRVYRETRARVDDEPINNDVPVQRTPRHTPDVAHGTERQETTWCSVWKQQQAGICVTHERGARLM